jgi:hypothetical protein
VRVGGLEDAFAAAAYLTYGCAGGDLVARVAAAADPRLDPALAQRLLERTGVVAAVGPQLARPDAPFGERVNEWQQVPSLVLVAGRNAHLQRSAGCVDG